MNEEQLNQIDFLVNIQLHILQIVKRKYHNNEWTDIFDEDVNETKNVIIYNLENNLLHPICTLTPPIRTFREGDENIRQEISNEVNRLFKIFRENQN